MGATEQRDSGLGALGAVAHTVRRKQQHDLHARASRITSRDKQATIELGPKTDPGGCEQLSRYDCSPGMCKNENLAYSHCSKIATHGKPGF